MIRGAGRAPAGPVVVVAEHAVRGLAPLSLELLTCGRQAAGLLQQPLRLVILGHDPEPAAEQLALEYGTEVTAVQIPGLEEFCGEAYARVLEELLPAWEPSLVLGPHSTGGLDWAPALAAAWGAACITGVEEVSQADGGLALRRAGLFGKAVQELAPAAWPLVATVQPGAFPAAQKDTAPAGKAELLTLAAPARSVRLIETRPGQGADATLGQAQVVVAAGRGIAKPENLELLRRLAGLFSRAALAGSRPVCDAGWLGYGHQVGLTGASVAPRLYLACGISGARQHTVGMQGSEFIVAINSDPQAAIFNLADVCLVEDLLSFIPELLRVAAESSRE